MPGSLANLPIWVIIVILPIVYLVLHRKIEIPDAE